MSNILVADDAADVRALIALKLTLAGHEVAVAEDGDAAIARAREGAWDLILLDWMMPGLTGPEVCRLLRQDPSFDAVPLMLLTAKAQPSDIEHGHAAGADDFMAKPFSPRELADRVAATLARGRSVAPHVPTAPNI